MTLRPVCALSPPLSTHPFQPVPTMSTPYLCLIYAPSASKLGLVHIPSMPTHLQPSAPYPHLVPNHAKSHLHLVHAPTSTYELTNIANQIRDNLVANEIVEYIAHPKTTNFLLFAYKTTLTSYYLSYYLDVSVARGECHIGSLKNSDYIFSFMLSFMFFFF